MKRLVFAVSAIGAVLLFLLASAGANTSLFAHNYSLLLWLNVVLGVGLAALVGIQLHTLWREYRMHVFGSRLKLKLIGMFLLLAVVPGTVIYLVSVQFAVRSIESWHNVRVDSTLESGVELGRSALEALVDQLGERVRSLAIELSVNDTPPKIAALAKARDQLGVDELTLLTTKPKVLVTTGGIGQELAPDVPSAQQLILASQGRGYRAVEGAGDKLVMRVIVPLSRRQLNTGQLSAGQLNAGQLRAGQLSAGQLSADTLLLQVRTPVPETLAKSAESLQELHRNYQELLLARQGLKRIYVITLTLALLLAMSTAMALAFVFAKALSAPLLILAEGTQAVASGDFTPRQALPARDELGVLTQSFNRMTKQLLDARAQADKHRSAVDSARAYLESVLSNLSAGVLAFSADGKLRASNRGATGSLRDELTGFETIPLMEWPRLHVFRDAVLSGFAERDENWHRQIEIAHDDGSTQTLLLHGSRLPANGGGGFVVVFDDISELISAQRNAAWAEVARRLAHEIKNPLTPIQLSAERLEHKLAERLEPTDRAFLARATQTIVNQVEAMKNLVNSFRDYARLPPPKLAAVDLNALATEILNLYDASAVTIRQEYAVALPPVQADASQIRQVIHNLMQNAQDAVADRPDPCIWISTRQDGRRVELGVRDNGPGFAPAIINRATEPYATTKPRGSGLGLAIVRKIVDEHHGELHLGNRSEGGAEIRVRLRIAKENEV